jgi:superfamily II DNA helicase RecQ
MEGGEGFALIRRKMAYKIINIPLSPGSKLFNADELNKFCINKKIIERKVEFFQHDGTAYWSVFIDYEPILDSFESKPVGLSEAGRVCFEKLRQWRKETAEAEGIPPFVIAKNSHLVEIINKEIVTLEALKQVNGFGKKKVEKYGEQITGIISAFFKEKRKAYAE